MSVGIFTSQQLTQDLARKSFAGLITRLMPNGSAPLFAMTSMISEETAVQVEHGFFTKTAIFPQLTLSSSATSTDTILNVTNTNNVLPGMIMRVDSTFENVIINSVVSANQVSVTRGVGSVSAAAISSAINLWQVGSAFEESSLRPNALNINPVRITNLTQIFRNTWAVSGTIAATQMIAGDTNIAESRQDCAFFHATNIETGIIFGQKSQGTRNGQSFRTMDGIERIVSNLAYYPSSYSSANVTTFGSTTTFTQLENALDPLFNQTTDPKGAAERILFVGGTAKKALNKCFRLNGTYFIANGQTDYGLQFDSFKISRGMFRIIEHPLFNTNATWSKMAIAVDLTTFNVAYLNGRKTQNKEFNMDGDATDNGIDAMGGTLTTELTTLIKNPPANGIYYNLTDGAVG